MPVTMQDLIHARVASLKRLQESGDAIPGTRLRAEEWADVTRKDLSAALLKHGPVLVRTPDGWRRYAHDERHGYGITAVELPPPADEVVVEK